MILSSIICAYLVETTEIPTTQILRPEGTFIETKSIEIFNISIKVVTLLL